MVGGKGDTTWRIVLLASYGAYGANPLNVSTSTAAIILAAGSSSRRGGGRHKLLLPLDGRPVLTHVIDALLASQARPLVIVLRHQAAQVRPHLDALHPESNIIGNTAYL